MVLTKFIEGAREVEMDAVGKDGRVSALSPSPRSLPPHHVSSTCPLRTPIPDLAVLKQIRGPDFYKTGL